MALLVTNIQFSKMDALQAMKLSEVGTTVTEVSETRQHKEQGLCFLPRRATLTLRRELYSSQYKKGGRSLCNMRSTCPMATSPGDRDQTTAR